MRGDAQHPHLLDPVPGDAEISGGNLTEREMRATGLRLLEDVVAIWGTSGLYGK
jgi:hypothetical protein